MIYIWRPGPAHNHLFAPEPNGEGVYHSLCGLPRKNLASRWGEHLKFCRRCLHLGQKVDYHEV